MATLSEAAIQNRSNLPAIWMPAVAGQEAQKISDSIAEYLKGLVERPPRAVKWIEGWATLPMALSDSLLQEIERSREILRWGDDWDDAGSPAYTKAALNRALSFLMENLTQLWLSNRLTIATPKVLPGPNGSIDIHWKLERCELLVNIPADHSQPATFYGDKKSGGVVNGTIGTWERNEWLFEWLTE